MSTIDPAGSEGRRDLSCQLLLNQIFLDAAQPMELQTEEWRNEHVPSRFGVVGLYGRTRDSMELWQLFQQFDEALAYVALPELLLLLIRADVNCQETAERIALWLRERGQMLNVAYLAGECRVTEAWRTRAIFEAAAAELFFHNGQDCLPLSVLAPVRRTARLEEKDLRRLRQLRRDICACLVRGDSGCIYEKLEVYYDLSARGSPALFREQCASLYFRLGEELAAPDEKQGEYRSKLRREGKTVFQFMEEANSAREIREHLSWYLDRLLAWYRPLRKDTSCRVSALVEDYVGKHYMEQVDVRDIAVEAGLSANYVRSIFRSSRGKTIQQYLSEYRLEMACQLLRSTSATVSRVGQLVGYNNVSYFCASFQKRYGKTPGEWRRDL